MITKKKTYQPPNEMNENIKKKTQTTTTNLLEINYSYSFVI